MPIDLEGLAILDMLLDATIELHLFPNSWTEQELKLLNQLHRSILRLNNYWATEDEPTWVFLHDIRAPLMSVRGYFDLFEMVMTQEKKDAKLADLRKIRAYVTWMTQRIDYLEFQLKCTE